MPLRTNNNVVHAGLSLSFALLKVLTKSRVDNFFHSLSNNLFPVPLDAMVAMVVGKPKVSSTLSQRSPRRNLNIHTPLEMEEPAPACITTAKDPSVSPATKPFNHTLSPN